MQKKSLQRKQILIIFVSREIISKQNQRDFILKVVFVVTSHLALSSVLFTKWMIHCRSGDTGCGCGSH